MNIDIQQESLEYATVGLFKKADWLSVESILSEKVVRIVVPELIKLGAEGIIKYPLNKII